jgi:hypothetical protein
MDLVEKRINKAITSCQRALDNLQQGNKRLSVGDLDHAKEYILASIHLLIAEVKEEEGSF